MDALVAGVGHDFLLASGTIVGIVIGLSGAVGGMLYGGRWKLAWTAERAVAQSLSEGRAAYKERCERLEEEARAHLEVIGRLRTDIETLSARPTEETVVAMLNQIEAQSAERMALLAERMTQVEQRSLDRHDEEIRILENLVRFAKEHESGRSQ